LEIKSSITMNRCYKNKKVITKLSSPSSNKQSLLDGLVGFTAQNLVSFEEAKQERLSRQ